MAELQSRVTRCIECHKVRAVEDLAMVPRPPCACGASGIAVQVGLAEELNIVGNVDVRLIPPDPERNWEQRWAGMQRDLATITVPAASQMSRDEIRRRRDDLLDFFVTAYHLKDALIASGSVQRKTVEDRITNDPDLALLADLANLDKHAHLSKPPRSGAAPTLTNTSATASGSGEGGWRLVVEIAHAGAVRDGIECAMRAIAAWRQALSDWSLV